MLAINVAGKGVFEIPFDETFYDELVSRLENKSREGLSAILVGDDDEAKYLLREFSKYERKFHDMTDEDHDIHPTRWNILHIDDAKGLEFTNVIVLSGRMSRNQRYIAYTRALDALYVCQDVIDVKAHAVRTDDSVEKDPDSSSDSAGAGGAKQSIHKGKEQKDHTSSEVREFFVSAGLEVLDQRDSGGRLWVIGDKASIKETVNAAIARFNISGKYAVGKETKNRSGWCTKTDK